MDDAANERAIAKLRADALAIVDQLDREIEQLRQVAPRDYDGTINELTEAVLTIREAITDA